MKLTDKVALITGSSRGIGKAIALLLAKEGVKVAINYFKSEKEALKVVEEVKKLSSQAIAIQCDVSQEEEVKSMVNQVISKWGRIDILVNNAGIAYDEPLFTRAIDQWRRTIDVNLLGSFLCSKYVGKILLEQKFGKIINITSTNAINSFNPNSVDYDASKAGIITLTKDFAKELAPFVQVNAIAPGWVDTEMNNALPDSLVNEETNKIYLKRFAKPEEIAQVALFLASEQSSYLTGSIIIADGGHD